MRKLTLLLMFIIPVLAGCDTALFPADAARTDRVTFNLRVSNVSRDQLDGVCGRHANGCVRANDNGDKMVFMHGYPSGLRNIEVTIQFVSWNKISGFGKTECGGAFFGTNSCLKDGVIYAYDFGYYDVENIFASDTITSRSESGVIGSLFAELLGYPKNQFNWEQVLGHEIMAHIVPAETKE